MTRQESEKNNRVWHSSRAMGEGKHWSARTPRTPMRISRMATDRLLIICMAGEGGKKLRAPDTHTHTHELYLSVAVRESAVEGREQAGSEPLSRISGRSVDVGVWNCFLFLIRPRWTRYWASYHRYVLLCTIHIDFLGYNSRGLCVGGGLGAARGKLERAGDGKSWRGHAVGEKEGPEQGVHTIMAAGAS